MLVQTKLVRRLFIAAGLTAIAASANAFVLIDPQIMIDRAIGSPTLTIRYKGVTASLVELKINGSSVGTRTVDGVASSGETNFTLNVGDLHDGDNEVVVRIFDRTGKLVAEDKTDIQTAAPQQGPVFMTTPKTGATVQGTIKMQLGFDHDLKDCYVSFFVDGSFKSMSNVPPFEYAWDTEAETNGWHQVEAWAIDDSSNTHKTGQVRVFVNNPHGDTFRAGTSPDVLPTPNVSSAFTIKSAAKPLRKNVIKSHKFMVADFKPLPSAEPKISAETVLGSPSKVKPMVASTAGIVMGVKTQLPTGTRVAHHSEIKSALIAKSSSPTVEVKDPHAGMVVEVSRHVDQSPHVNPPVLVAMADRHVKQAGTVANVVVSNTSLMNISRGSRLPNLSSFYIALDSDFVDFHGVMPRVDDGVPMTPLRFLLEKKGGLVDWDNFSKTVFAKADGNDLTIHIGDPFALLNQGSISLERPSYLDRGRTVVPLSFMEKALNVNIQYDKSSNHVLITSKQK